MRRLVAVIGAVAIACVASCQSSQATPKSNPAIAVDRFLSAQSRDEKFSGTVLIAQQGKVLLSKAYGWADEQKRQANDVSTAFEIGSLTKQFTAMGILLLQERGKLSVNDRVCQYISRCPKAWTPITLQNLLTHTSAIPNYPAGQRLSPGALLAYLEQQPLDFPPGSRFSYSNSGYAVLGFVIEKVSGEPYADFLRQEIFDPLQLTNTGDVLSSTSVSNLAVGYSQPWTPAPPSGASPFFAAGTLYSTVGNLYAWDTALFGDTFATAEVRNEMFTPQITACDSAGNLCQPADCAKQVTNCFSYGYGWFLQQLPIRQGYVRVFWHSGLVPGFTSLSYYYPDQKLAVIVLSNLESFAADADSIVAVVDLALS